MSDIPPNWQYTPYLPGNSRILGSVDHGTYNVSIFKRTWMLLNRNYNVTTEGKVFWLHNVVLHGPFWVDKSTKMGKVIKHPEYSFYWRLSTAPVTQGSCFLRSDNTTLPTKFSTLTIAVLCPNGLASDPNKRIISPPWYPSTPQGHKPNRTACSF